MSTGKWFLKMHLQKPQSAGTYGECRAGDGAALPQPLEATEPQPLHARLHELTHADAGRPATAAGPLLACLRPAAFLMRYKRR